MTISISTLVTCALLASASIYDVEDSATRACTSSSLPPKGTICSQHDHVSRESTYDYGPSTSVVDDRAACRDLCLGRQASSNTQSCTTFSFSTRSKLCSLYDQSLTGGDGHQYLFRDDSQSTAFWRHTCFQCPGPCARVGPSTLDNGGFESSETHINPWFTPLKSYFHHGSVVSPGHGSPRAWFCGTKDQDFGCAIEQAVNLCPPDAVYLLEFEYNLQLDMEDFGFFYISLRRAYHRGGPLRSKTPQGLHVTISPLPSQRAAGWKRAQFYIVAQKSPAQRLRLELPSDKFSGNTANITLDNVSLTKYQNSTVPALGAVEHIEDGGFESGGFFPFWSSTGDATVAAPGINSNCAAYLSPDKNGFGSGIISESIQLTEGAQHVLSFDYKLINPAKESGHYYYFHIEDVAPAGDASISDALYYFDVTGKNIVNSHRQLFVPQTNQTRFAFVMASSTYGDRNTNQKFMLDNISVKAL